MSTGDWRGWTLTDHAIGEITLPPLTESAPGPIQFTLPTLDDAPATIPPDAVVKRAEPKPTVVYDTYWRFLEERQAIYFRRLWDQPVLINRSHIDGTADLVDAWTQDPILQQYRFTNVYRAADRVSQYLIRHVLYDGATDASPREIIYRTLLFKIFNKISTWERLLSWEREKSCRITSWKDGGIVCAADALTAAKEDGETIYSAAYMMPSPGNAKEKHIAHLQLINQIVGDGAAVWMKWMKLVAASSFRALYETLRTVPSFGPFLAYQIALDLNYSEIFHFSENEFVAVGPGTRDGLHKCFSDFGDYSEADVIRWVCDRQDREFERLGLSFKNLFGRPLHLSDCANGFCETDKYARVVHPDVDSRRKRIKQLYKPDSVPLPRPFFPPKWNLHVDLTRGGL